jgi:hypothetical protein
LLGILIKAYTKYWDEAITPEILEILSRIILHNPSSFIMMIPDEEEDKKIQCRTLTISKETAHKIS